MSNAEQGYAEGWRPSEGDEITGTVADIDRGWSSQQDAYYPIVTLNPEDGGDPVAVHAFHASLKARLTDLKPAIGEKLFIRFVGKREQKNRPDRMVAVYQVKVYGRSTEQVWGAFEDAPKTVERTSDIPESDDLPF